MPPAPSPARLDLVNELYGETLRLNFWVSCRGCCDVKGSEADTDHKTDVRRIDMRSS